MIWKNEWKQQQNADAFHSLLFIRFPERPAVIFAAVVVIFYLNFVNYVVRYRKKPPKIKKKKVIAAAPAPAEETAGGEE